MSSETIIVQIDPDQLKQQKINNYSLYLAKMVNGVFTVIWQSMGPYPTPGNSSYEPSNTFNITVPAYEVNYANVTEVDGSVSFTSQGIAVTMQTGQVVTLDNTGLFETPENGGTPGSLTVMNNLADNPNEMISDESGNVIYVNTTSGMDIGKAVITPIDTYQVWFSSFQKTSTLIIENFSNFATVTFDGTSSTQTISYTNAGTWQQGPLPPAQFTLDSVGHMLTNISVMVVATLSAAVSTLGASYVLNNLVSKFSSGLKPSSIKVARGSNTIEITFQTPKESSLALDKYETAVNKALHALVSAHKSPLGGDTWTLNEPQLCAAF